MNCPFCHLSLVNTSVASNVCENHNDIELDFLIVRDKIKHCNFTFYSQDERWTISLDYQIKDCWLIKKQKNQIIIKLDCFPDVTPDNARQWLNRLLNMKAFY